MVDHTDESFNRRILICDDNKSIHDDLMKIFKPPKNHPKAEQMRAIEQELFDAPEEFDRPDRFHLNLEIDSAFSGKEAVAMAEEADREGRPYALIFMDVRMPPGPDGILTIQQIWEIMPHTEVVIVTAYSDYSWDEILEKLGVNDKLLYLRKPFSSITVKQLALNLTTRWNSAANLREKLHKIESDARGGNPNERAS